MEKVWCELGAAFVDRGHEVTIIGRGAPDFPRAQGPAGPRYVSVHGFDASGHIAVDLAKDLLYALCVARRIPHSDIVVTNTFWAPVVLALQRKWKKRIVVHAARFPKGQMWLYRSSAAIQAISSPVADAIRKQSPSVADKVRVLGYPVDLSVFTPRSVLDGVTPRNAILYVGRVHPEKGIHLLLDAFRRVVERVPDATLEIIGSAAERQGGGGAGYLRNLESAAAGLRVTFAGPLSDERALASAYRRAACFCYPSVAERGEAFGRAVLEAMSCGLPCVISALDCFGDFSLHGENVVVFDHKSADAAQLLAGEISTILGDQGYAAHLGRAARMVAERFSVDRMAGKYLELFDSVAMGACGSCGS